MAPESSNLKKGTRVVLVDDLPGVKAGTAGRVGRSIGIKSTRYRVHFETVSYTHLTLPTSDLV